MLGGQSYPNNSVFLITNIGEGNSALLCVTDREGCCGNPSNRIGEWLYPNSTTVPNYSENNDFYRNRGPNVVRLNRRNNAFSPTGRYHCMIPDASGTNQILTANIIGKH